MNQVAEIVVFNVAREVAYHTFLLFFQCHDHSEFTGKGSRSEEELRELLMVGRPVVKEWEYPKGFTIDHLNGPAIVRTTMQFVGIASRTVVVSWGYSLHPQNFLGSVLTAIPRMRLKEAAPGIRDALWRLKVDCEGHAFDHVLKHLMAPASLANLDPPEDTLRTVIDAQIWHRGMTLLEAASYFDVLRAEMGQQAALFEQLSEELQMTGRLHLSLASDEGVTEARLDAVRRAYIKNFERLALSEHDYDLQLLSLMMPYFMSLRKSLVELGSELPHMSEQAGGSRTAMAEMLLEYAAPDFAEMNRITEGMPGSNVAIAFRHWAEQRRPVADDDTAPLSSTQSGASTVKEIQLTCAWSDSESLLRELVPYVGDGVKFEVRHHGPRFRGGEIDSTVLVALVSGGAVVVSGLISALMQVRLKKVPDGTGKLVYKSPSGMTLEVPSNCTMEQLREFAEIAHTFDRSRIDLE